MINLRKINYGIASRQGDTIYLNKKLDFYPDLQKAILNHEKEHTSNFSWHDIILDIRNHHLRGLKLKYWAFIIRNPSSWTEFLPFMIYDKRISVNPLILSIYGLFFALIGGLGWLLA